MVGAGAATDAARALAAREVCAASAAFASCTHRRRRRSSPRGPHFVDWYLVLSVSTSFHSRRRRRLPPIHSPILTRTCSWRRAQIGEAASEDAVRRRYRQLGEHAISPRRPRRWTSDSFLLTAYVWFRGFGRTRTQRCSCTRTRTGTPRRRSRSRSSPRYGGADHPRSCIAVPSSIRLLLFEPQSQFFLKMYPNLRIFI